MLVCVCVCVYVCVCVCARTCTYVCVCRHIVIVKYFTFVFEHFLAPCFIELLTFYCKMYLMLYVNDKPEGRFLYTVTIKLYMHS